MSPFVRFEMTAFGIDLFAALEVAFVNFSAFQGLDSIIEWGRRGW